MKKVVKDLGGGLVEVIEFFDDTKNIIQYYQLLNGKLHGEEVWYYENGKKRRRCKWVDGNLHGEDVWFYESGQIELKRYWGDSDLPEEEKWYEEDGSIAI